MELGMLSVSPEKIGAVMALSPLPQSFAELESRVSHGLPRAALKASVERICPGMEGRRLLHRIVPEATLKRRQERLSVEESERAERLARVYATALHVWSNDDDARAFLQAPHPMLEGRAPLEVSLSELGARRVEDVLWQLYFGLPA
jgi:putative toxin-antitoxin system antitoxin component (TIGR02293 family)